MGSEMCIRDRPIALGGLGDGDHRAPVAGVPVFHLGEVGRDLAIVCLLYTSDAADERSSVDLGGRRIIKKKNTQEREK